MTLDEFRATLAPAEAPQELSQALRAMWADARGDWHAAHTIAHDTLEEEWARIVEALL